LIRKILRTLDIQYVADRFLNRSVTGVGKLAQMAAVAACQLAQKAEQAAQAAHFMPQMLP